MFVLRTKLKDRALDVVKDAYAAYGLHLLRYDYKQSPLIRVRRVADNQEQDIYCTDIGSLDVTTLRSFAGSSVCTLVKMYDQTGRGRDAIQTVTANQPFVYNGKNVYKVNEYVMAYYNGSHYMVANAVAPILTGLNKPLSMFQRVTLLDFAANRFRYSFRNSTSTDRNYFDENSRTASQNWQLVSQDKDVLTPYTSSVVHGNYLAPICDLGMTKPGIISANYCFKYFFMQSRSGRSTGVRDTTYNSVDTFYIGARATSNGVSAVAGSFWIGYIGATVIYDRNLQEEDAIRVLTKLRI